MIDDKVKVFFFGSTKPKFALTANHLENFQATPEEVAHVKELGMTDFFELYDDDNIKYYSGYANLEAMEEWGDECDEECDEFAILYMATIDSGCTYIKFRNKDTGKMEIV